MSGGDGRGSADGHGTRGGRDGRDEHGRRVRFGGLEVAAGDEVLAPRPWTVAQSAWAAELADRCGPGPLLELCAGAGAIGLEAARRTRRPAVLVDEDPAACASARANAAANGLAAAVEVRCAPVTSALAPGERFPLVLADPPYVPAARVDQYPEDPDGAIDGGPDGLAVVWPTLAAAARALLPGSPVVLQLGGLDQVAAVERALATGARPLPLVVREVRRIATDRVLVRLDRRGSTPGGGRRRDHAQADSRAGGRARSTAPMAASTA